MATTFCDLRLFFTTYLLRLAGLGGLPEDLLCVGEHVPDPPLLAGDVVVEGLVLLELDSDYVRLRGGRVRLADLRTKVDIFSNIALHTHIFETRK